MITKREWRECEMKIELVIDESRDLPIVRIDGEEVEGLLEINLDWKTNDKYLFSIKSFDRITRKITGKSFESI